MSVQMRNSKTIAPIDLTFLHNMYYTHFLVLGSGSRSGLKNFFKDSSPLGDMTKYAIKVRPGIQRLPSVNLHPDDHVFNEA